MNKKAKKTLVSGLAVAMGTGIVAPSIVQAAGVDVNALYAAAYNATMKAEADKTQVAINAARTAIAALKGTGAEWAIPTFSSRVDKIQQAAFEKFMAIIFKDGVKVAKLTQAQINEAKGMIVDFNTFEGNKQYVPSWSTAVDQFQQANIDAAHAAITKAKASGSQADWAEAKKLVDELLTVTNNDDIKKYVENNMVKLLAVEVKSVQTLEAKKVAFGTKFEQIGLPETVKVTLSNGQEATVKVKWVQGAYNGNDTASYVVSGTLDLTGIANVAETKLQATITVTVDVDPDLKDQDAATKAVEAYEKAPLTKIEEVNAAKEAKKLAVAAIAKIDNNSDLKAKLTARVEAQDAKVAKAEADLNRPKVEAVSAVTNINTFTVTFKDDVKAEALTGKKLTLTPAKGDAVVATFKSLDGKVATFEFAKESAEAEYVVSGTDFVVAEGTKVTYDKTAPTIKVADSKFADYKTIKIALSEKVTGTPVVKINGVAEKAENVVLAKDGMSLTITRAAGFTQGLYTVTVNGLTDVAKNAMLADANMNIRKDASVVTEFKYITTGVSTAANNKVYFSLIDQYGLDITSTASLTGLSGEAVMNNLPLTVSSVQKDVFGAYVTLSEALVENTNVKVTLTNKDTKGNVLGTTVSPNFVVSKTAPVASKIVAIKSAKTETPSGTQLVLTADIRDQYNNPATASNITWTTSDVNVVGLPSGASFEKGTSSITVNAGTVGTAEVRAFLADGTEVTAPLTITVTQGELNTVTPQIVGGLQVTNNKVAETADLLVNIDASKYPAGTDYLEFKNANNQKISVKAADVELTAKVTSNSKDASSEVSFEKVADANGNLTGIKVITNRTDVENLTKNYTVTIKVGEKVNTFTFDSVIDQTVSAIEIGDVAQNALTTNKQAVVPVTFKNKYGEKVSVTAGNFNVSQLGSLTIEKGTVDANGVFSVVGNSAAVTHIRYTGTSAATYNVFFSVGNATLQKVVATVPAGIVSGMTLGTSNVSVIKDDTLDAKTVSSKDDVVVVGGYTYKLVPVSFKDNYGNDLDVAAAQIAKSGADNLDVLYFSDRIGTVATTAVKYIGVREDSLTDATAQRNITFEIKDVNNKVLASSNLLVDVKEARKLDHLVVDNSSASAVVGAVSSFKVVGLDQYGRYSAIGALTLDNDYNGTLVRSNEVVNGPLVTFNLAATKAGSYVAKLKYTVGQDVKTVDIALNVGEIGSVINTLQVSPYVYGSNDAVYDASKYQVKFENGVTTVAAVALDANGNEVAVNNGDVKYYIESIAARSNGTKPTVTINETTGVISGTNVLDGDKVVVRATSTNGKTSTMTITLGVSDSIAQAGSYFLSNDEDGYDAYGYEVAPVTTVDMKDDNNSATVDNVKKLYIVARDQYGMLFNVDESQFVVGQDSGVYFTAVNATNAIVVTGKAEGSSTIRVFLKGTQLGTVTVTVNKNALPVAP